MLDMDGFQLLDYMGLEMDLPCIMVSSDEEYYNSDGTMPKKKNSVAWTQESHEKFMEAIKILGVHKAVPTKILEITNVHRLTRAQIVSHLQKYRSCLKMLERKVNIIASMGPLSHLSLLQLRQQNCTKNITNFPLSLGRESVDINTNMDNWAIDPMLNLSGTNQRNNTMQNDVFASVGNSQNKGQNVMELQREDDFFTENSYMKGDMSSSGSIVDDFINLEEIAGK